MAHLIAYVSNDNLLEIDGLRDGTVSVSSAGTYLTGETGVTVTLVNKSSANVSGASWPVTMSFVSGSSGKYRATLADTLSLSSDAQYRALITANAGAGKKGFWDVPVIARTRSS